MKRSGIMNAQLAGALAGLLEELVVEGATAAEEVERNPTSYELLTSRLPALGFVSHEDLKRMVAGARLICLALAERNTPCVV